MPPSPAMRISPGRELRMESHKRGRSLESGSLYREDDELALFNEVQNKESDNFLLQSNDDFDDMFGTKLRGLSNHKIGISIPPRGQSSDLLNAEGDKNDYDWLITPPETPLFSSLDDETPLVNLATRGRPRAQPISISRSQSPMMEKGYPSRRGSPSPNRLSTSPQSGNNTLQSRSRPFSATHSSPPPNLRHSPSRGLSPPPSKPKTGPRSSTPTPGWVSTSSAGSTGASVRGVSPVQTSRGNSVSPKLRAWQSNIPGFSLEAPPNLRTSLADRPASYVRGSSPASRIRSRTGRQSMSPTPSRRVSSSHSHERDPFCSHSKGSVASSGDDDMDSLQSVPISSSDRSAPRITVGSSNGRVVGFSKKPAKLLSSSAPKRSFDLPLRQMERKTPQNMFRPLLSSVPSSTFNAALHHCSLTSINSSITTSSNASSDQGTSGAHDTEENEHCHEDVTSNSLRVQYPDMPGEVFVMDQTDALIEDIEKSVIIESPLSRHDDTATFLEDTDVILDINFDCTVGNGAPDVLLCLKCGGMFPYSEIVMEDELQVCLECKSVEIDSTVTVPLKKVMESNITAEAVQVHLGHESLEICDNFAPVPESFTVTGTSETEADRIEKVTEEDRRSYNEPNQNLGISPTEEQICNQTICAELGENSKLDIGPSPNSQVDFAEGAGISLVLKRSNSGKRHIVQSRSFTASNISCDDFSYSFGHSSVSVSSSIDMGHSRQTSTYIQRQLNGVKSEMDNYRYEMATKHNRSSSSLSGASSHVYQVPSVTPSYNEDSYDLGKLFVASELTEAESICTDVESDNVLETVSEEMSHLANDHSGDNEMTSILAFEDQASLENNEVLIENCGNSMAAENSSVYKHTFSQGENATIDEVLSPSLLDAIKEIDIENPDVVSVDSQSEVASTNSNRSIDELLEPTALEGLNDGEMVTVGEINVSDHVHGVSGELTVLLDEMNSTKARSLTLDEATEAILFCSSIVHNLAYEAANIAIDKENPQFQVLQPTLPVLGKSGPEKRETRPRKRSTKSQKARQRKFETETKTPFVVSETDEKPTQRIIGTPNKADSMKPPKVESKCNCTIM